MRIAVFGSTGRTGKHLIEQALSQGHSVTAFARTPSKLSASHPQLHIVQGDLLKAESVEMAVEGQDVVLSVLGPKHGGPSTTLVDGTENIIRAMKKHGVERILCVLTAGFLDEQADSLMGKLLLWYYRFNAKEYLTPAQLQYQSLQQSGLKWTAIRVVLLNEGASKRHYLVSEESIPKGGYQINTGDLAAFMLQQLASDEFVERAPVIVY